jgi:hypothetical protein
LPSVKLLWFVGTKLERAFCVGTCGEHRDEFASPEPIAASATIIPVTATGFDFEAEPFDEQCRAIARQRRSCAFRQPNILLTGTERRCAFTAYESETSACKASGASLDEGTPTRAGT